MAKHRVSFLTQKVAQEIDVELMSPGNGFAIEQLMELAGLSVAQAVFREYPPKRYPRIAVCCGPGNNGGDGLVAARHLCHFGYVPSVYYPKRSSKELFGRLVTQLQNLNVRFIESVVTAEDFGRHFADELDVIVDAIFGFSFSGDVRPPFQDVIQAFRNTKTPIVSVDIPSGWDVEKGNLYDRFFAPEMLVSLTAPKLGVKNFAGKHWLGGRFVPPELAKRYDLNLPSYHETDQCVKLSSNL